ncbi:MAG: type I methionyl aminopeptidase [Saprospiraceae bacterium]|nr:type I methionyl aminopeptidase [Saprospiraceae bacterium]
MIYIKHEEEIELIRKSALLVSNTLALIAELLKEGVTGLYLDQKAEEFIRSHNAIPAFKGLNGYPGTLCISKNEAVVHGIPNKDIFKQGDTVSIDCGVLMNEFYGDSAYTFIIGDSSEEIKKLVRVTEESLYKGIDQAIAGNRVGDISYAIMYHTEKMQHYGVVKELVGHGVGRNLHEAPEVPNYGSKGKGPMLKEGMVIAIEPMINLGTRQVKQLNDGWTIVTKDGKCSAHFEHTLVIRKDKAEILSDHQPVKESIKNNPELLKYFV